MNRVTVVEAVWHAAETTIPSWRPRAPPEGAWLMHAVHDPLCLTRRETPLAIGVALAFLSLTACDDAKKSEPASSPPVTSDVRQSPGSAAPAVGGCSGNPVLGKTTAEVIARFGQPVETKREPCGRTCRAQHAGKTVVVLMWGPRSRLAETRATSRTVFFIDDRAVRVNEMYYALADFDSSVSVQDVIGFDPGPPSWRKERAPGIFGAMWKLPTCTVSGTFATAFNVREFNRATSAMEVTRKVLPLNQSKVRSVGVYDTRALDAGDVPAE